MLGTIYRNFNNNTRTNSDDIQIYVVYMKIMCNNGTFTVTS